MFFKKFWLICCFFFLFTFTKTVFKERFKIYYKSNLKILNDYPILTVCLQIILSKKTCSLSKKIINFTCELNFQFECLKKIMNDKQLLENLKKCNLSKKILFYKDEVEPHYFLNGKYLCITFDNEKFITKKKNSYAFYFHKDSKLDYDIFFHLNKSLVFNRSIYRRKCYKINPSQSNIICRQAHLLVNFDKLKRLRKPFKTDCINYGSDEKYEIYNSQFDCMKKCYENRKKYLENSSNVIYKNISSFQLIKECLNKICFHDDCFSDYFRVDQVYYNNKNPYNKIIVSFEYLLSEAQSNLFKESLINYVLGILSSLFGFNFYNQIIRCFSFFKKKVFLLTTKNYKFSKGIIRYKLNKYFKLIKSLLILSITFICFYQFYYSVQKYFMFEISNNLVQNYDTLMNNFIVSVCFKLDNILIDKNVSIYNYTLIELENSTVKNDKLFHYVKLETNLKILRINFTDNISWFIWKNSKCYDFLIKYEETVLEKYMRVSEVKISAKRKINFLFIRNSNLNPTYALQKIPEKNFNIKRNIYIKKNVFFKQICRNYDYEKDNCYDSHHCINKCIIQYFKKKGDEITSELLVDKNEIYRNKKFKLKENDKNSNFTYEKFFKICQEKFMPDCRTDDYESTRFVYSTEKANFTKNNTFFNIHIKTTYLYDHFKYENLDLLYSFINLSSLWFGFSLPLLIEYIDKIIIQIKPINKFKNLLKAIFNLFLLGFLYLHVFNFIYLFLQFDGKTNYYLIESKETFLPSLSICFKNPSFQNNLTVFELDKKFKLSETISWLKIYDTSFNKLVFTSQNLSKYYEENYFITSEKEIDELNTKNRSIKDFLKINSFFFLDFKCFEFKVLYLYSLVGYRLLQSPMIFKIRINSKIKKMNVILSDLLEINLKSKIKLEKNQKLEIHYKRVHKTYYDCYYYFKKPIEIFRRKKPQIDSIKYFDILQDKFNEIFNYSTTLVPILNKVRHNNQINNEMFKKFYLDYKNQDLEKNIFQEILKYESIKSLIDITKIIDEDDETIIKIKLNFLKFILEEENKLSLCETFLYFLLIIALYFELSFVDLPFAIYEKFKHIFLFKKPEKVKFYPNFFLER